MTQVGCINPSPRPSPARGKGEVLGIRHCGPIRRRRVHTNTIKVVEVSRGVALSAPAVSTSRSMSRSSSSATITARLRIFSGGD
jgi:hypothetical protein